MRKGGSFTSRRLSGIRSHPEKSLAISGRVAPAEQKFTPGTGVANYKGQEETLTCETSRSLWSHPWLSPVQLSLSSRRRRSSRHRPSSLHPHRRRSRRRHSRRQRRRLRRRQRRDRWQWGNWFAWTPRRRRSRSGRRVRPVRRRLRRAIRAAVRRIHRRRPRRRRRRIRPRASSRPRRQVQCLRRLCPPNSPTATRPR